MARLHLFEFHDLPWVPRVWRQILTETIVSFYNVFGVFRPFVPRILEALDRSTERTVVDFGSGAGGPLPSLYPLLSRSRRPPLQVFLTDRYPNPEAVCRFPSDGPGPVRYVAEPVDASRVPPHLTGFRTLFSSFHHFAPDDARRILRDAVDRRAGIAVAEFTERRLAAILTMFAIPFFVWITAPFAFRPFTLRKAFWTYVLPLPVFLVVWDGIVSCLRTYSPDELLGLAESVSGDGYAWESGRLRSVAWSRVTYLIGVPSGPQDGGARKNGRFT
jgi:hypothetical protein